MKNYSVRATYTRSRNRRTLRSTHTGDCPLWYRIRCDSVPCFGSNVRSALLFPRSKMGIIYWLSCWQILLSPYGLLDIVFGSLATLLAAFATAKMPNKWLAPLPPIICNGVIIGALLAFYNTGFTAAYPAAFAFNALTVGLGELIACYAFGGALLIALPKIPFFRMFWQKNLIYSAALCASNDIVRIFL